MLKKFSVKNFKNFKNEIVLDFTKVGNYQFSTDCLSNGLISKMLIYGRNATGKTNFIRAISDIRNLILDIPILDRGAILNADTDEKTIDFRYVYNIDNQEITYNYSRLPSGLLTIEELYLNKKRIFRCEFQMNHYDFSGLNLVSAKTLNSDVFLNSIYKTNGTHSVLENTVPFLRWIIANTVLENSNVLKKLFVQIALIVDVLDQGNSDKHNRVEIDAFFKRLESETELKRFNTFLNDMGVDCRLQLKKLPDGRNELYFVHDKNLVPFYATASSGTLAISNLYRSIFFESAIGPSFLLLDEFDAYYHYEMANNLVRYLKNHYRSTQVILTTHNTNLISNNLMRPDCLFILSRDGRLTPFNRATQRELREGHNLEKMYISGEFEKYE